MKGVNIDELINQFGESIDKYVIYLDIPSELTSIAGNTYGRTIYDNQIEPILAGLDFKGTNVFNETNSDGVFILVFPSHIKYVAIGFVQGIMYKWGSEAFIDRFRVLGNDKFVDKFLADVRF